MKTSPASFGASAPAGREVSRSGRSRSRPVTRPASGSRSVEVALRDRFAAALTVEAERYGAAPPLTLGADGELSGSLVVASQARRLAEALPELAAALAERPVLAAAEDPATTAGWSLARVRTPLFAAPTGDKLATEVRPGDPPLRRLALEPVSGRGLVQTVAGTLGWAPLGHNRPLPADQASQRLADFLATPRAPRGECVVSATAADHRAALAGLLAEARDWARHAIPYRLGAADPSAAIDCSALTQRLFQRHFSFWLPRHSSDQKRCGRRIGRAALGSGDLVFATARRRRIFHVALAVAPGRVVHACLTEGRVVEEALDDFFQRYTFRAATRLVASPDTAETA